MPSIHDVARAAGVSISTVSYALSGKRAIGESTRERINLAVEKLGYEPHAGARMLAGTRTNILALTAPMHSETYAPAHMAFVLSVVTAARDYDYDVLLLTQDEAISGLRRVTSSRLVDGIIALDVSAHDERADLIRTIGCPATMIGIPADTTGLTCVDLDFEEAARLSIRSLHRQGHRSIGFIGHPEMLYTRESNFPLRFREALAAEVAELGVSSHEVRPDQDWASLRRAFDELSARLPEMTAVVLNCNEPVQQMLLELFRERSIRVPDDLSLVSACSSFSTDQFEPPLDVIPLPAHITGRRGVELTMRQLEGIRDPVVELIPPVYIAKGSTAPVV